MTSEFCTVFECGGVKYALLSTIYPDFGREQLLNVVRLSEGDTIAPNRVPASAEVQDVGEGPFAFVRSETAAHGWRQARIAQLAVRLSVGNTARAQLEAIEASDGRGLGT